MCYRIELKTGIKEIANRFNVNFDPPASTLFNSEINGFDFATHPIITNTNPLIITTDYTWGLIPAWSKDDSIKKSTLNAKVETLAERAAFRDIIIKRCLVIATGYFEWRWNDERGKLKQKYEIHSSEEAIFAFAGLYANWTHPANGNIIKSFTIITTEANPQMRYIHNNKKRMPVMLNKSDETAWINGAAHEKFSYPNYNAELIAFAVNP